MSRGRLHVGTSGYQYPHWRGVFYPRELPKKEWFAFCEHDMSDDRPPRATGGWRYWRFHGEHYHGCYSPRHLGAKARRIRDELAAGRDVYAFFNNDAEGHAPGDARRLAGYVKNRAA